MSPLLKGNTIVLLFLCIFIAKMAKSQAWQQQLDSMVDAQNLDAAIAFGEKKIRSIPNDTIKSRLLFDLGLWYGWLDKREQSSSYYEKALLLEEKFAKPRPELIGLIYNNLAFNSAQINQYDQVIKFYKKAHETWYQYTYTDINNNLKGLSNLLFQLMDFGLKRDGEYYYTILEQYGKDFTSGNLKKYFDQYTPDEKITMLMFLQLAKVRYHTYMNHRHELQPLMFQFEQLFKQSKNLSDRSMYLEALDNMGYAERFAGRYKEGLIWYKKAESLAHTDFYRMKGAANQAVTLYYANEVKQALQYNQKALSFLPSNSKSLSILGLKAMRAELLSKNVTFEEAFKQLEMLFTTQLNKPIIRNQFISFKVSDFNEWIAEQQLSVFLFAGNSFLHSYSADSTKVDHLKIAHHFFGLASEMFSLYYSREAFTEGLEQFRNKINARLLETGMMLNLSESEWYITMSGVENNTSRHGWKSFLSSYGKSLGIPANWLQQRSALMMEKEIGVQSGLQDGQVRQQKTIRMLDSINQLIHQKAPRFLDFDTSRVSLLQYQKQMRNGQCMLRYFVTYSHVFGIALTPNRIVVKQLGITDFIKQEVLQWSTQVGNPTSNMLVLSGKLYQVLLAPFEKQIAGQQEIIVVSEGALNLLSFEAIGRAGPQKTWLPITYAYDVKLLELQRNFRTGNNATVAFAPDYVKPPTYTNLVKRGSDFFQLPGAEREAMQVATIFNGRLYRGAEANRENFLKSIGKYGMYHIAMHTFMDTLQYEKSCLVFSDTQKLYFKELYAQPLNAQMVVLSGCNTGVGVVQSGEGVMGLSRALAYSGVQSMVYALWELPDNETSQIIQYFYEALQKGVAKHEALIQAKQRFVTENPEKAHPFYWAGLVLNGNSSPVSKSVSVWWWLLVVSVVVGGVYLVRRRKNL